VARQCQERFLTRFLALTGNGHAAKSICGIVGHAPRRTEWHSVPRQEPVSSPNHARPFRIKKLAASPFPSPVSVRPRFLLGGVVRRAWVLGSAGETRIVARGPVVYVG